MHREPSASPLCVDLLWREDASGCSNLEGRYRLSASSLAVARLSRDKLDIIKSCHDRASECAQCSRGAISASRTNAPVADRLLGELVFLISRRGRAGDRIPYQAWYRSGTRRRRVVCAGSAVKPSTLSTLRSTEIRGTHWHSLPHAYLRTIGHVKTKARSQDRPAALLEAESVAINVASTRTRSTPCTAPPCPPVTASLDVQDAVSVPAAADDSETTAYRSGVMRELAEIVHIATSMRALIAYQPWLNALLSAELNRR